jgi:hypothetical protein
MPAWGDPNLLKAGPRMSRVHLWAVVVVMAGSLGLAALSQRASAEQSTTPVTGHTVCIDIHTQSTSWCSQETDDVVFVCPYVPEPAPGYARCIGSLTLIPPHPQPPPVVVHMLPLAP